MKRIGVLTSGGDSPGMNSAIRAVVRSGIFNDMEVYGIRRGYEGLIEGDIFLMDESSVGGIIQRGGTMLKTARSSYFMEEAGFELALNTIKNNGIEGVVVIGGDGSLRGALTLAKAGVRVVGIPATIDNDLSYSDYSIGFDTAVNTILDAVSKIRDTSSSHDRISIIEVMGRSSGQLAHYAGITGGADAVLVPEVWYDLDKICSKIEKGYKRGKMFSIIVKAEGFPISTQELAEELQNRLDWESRIVVLGHVQRGGSPTARDRMIASEMGHEAVVILKKDEGSKALGIRGDAVISMEIEEALNLKREFDCSKNDLAEILSI